MSNFFFEEDQEAVDASILENIDDGVSFNDPLDMATVLGMAEELFEGEKSERTEDENTKILSLFADECLDHKSKTQNRKNPPKGSFESWVRDINSGRKNIKDPL